MRRVVILVLSGVLLGVLLTGGAGALPGSQDLNALTWLSSVATVAALVVAVGIYRVQQSQNDAAHQELLDALKAQDEILQDLADATPSSESPAPTTPNDPLTPAPTTRDDPLTPAPTTRDGPLTPAPTTPDDPLTPAQREAVEAQYGAGSIAGIFSPGNRRDNRARLVRLEDGTLVSVSEGRAGDVRLRQVPRRGGRRRPRDPQPRGSRSP